MNPGKEVLCDKYEYDETKKLHLFSYKGEETCKLMDGDFYLYMTDLQPLKPIKPKSKLEPFKAKLYDIAKKNEVEHKGQIVDIVCPLCGEKSMYTSITNNRLFAACRNCFCKWPHLAASRVVIPGQSGP